MRTTLLALLIAVNPLEECASRLRPADPPARPDPGPTVDDPPAPKGTAAPAPSPAPKPTTAKRGVVAPPRPAPSSAPSPAQAPSAPPSPPPPAAPPSPAPPAPSPSAAPSAPPPPPAAPAPAFSFFAEPGTYGGLYPKAAEHIATVRNNATSLRKCYADANALNDVWSVSARVTIAKNGPRSISARVTHAGQPDASPAGVAIAECHKRTMDQWPWPPSSGIEGGDGGTAYLNVMSGIEKR